MKLAMTKSSTIAPAFIYLFSVNVIEIVTCLESMGKLNTTLVCFARGGGGYFRNFWVRMCHWDP